MPKYFGTDGIRGRANETLNVETVFKIGVFIGHYFHNINPNIVIGKDTRLSSDMFEMALSSGICASGSNAYLLGYCTTPALAYTCFKGDFEIGVMISASHNPYYDNGIKIFTKTGEKINEELELKIEQYIDGPLGINYQVDDQIGRVINYSSALNDYCAKLTQEFSDLKNLNLKLAFDLSNGGSVYTAPHVLKQLNINYQSFFDQPNGININQNCGSTHLNTLKEIMHNGAFDLGFAFDGDADRVLCIDNQGNLIDGDQIMYLLAVNLKAKHKLNKNTLVSTVMSNIGLYKALEKAGIKSDIVSVGDKYVLESILKNGYSFGGEQAGHIINHNISTIGDGLITALSILRVLNESNLTIQELLKDIKIYPQVLKNIYVRDKEKIKNNPVINQTIENIKNKLSDQGRVLVRFSGTEPLLRVMVEALSQELCEACVDEIIEVVKKYEEDH